MPAAQAIVLWLVAGYRRSKLTPTRINAIAMNTRGFIDYSLAQTTYVRV